MLVACGFGFIATVTEKGDLWAFGAGNNGMLGLSTDVKQLLLAADDVFDGEAVVIVAAGHKHTACVTAKGTLWTWGEGAFSKLGHGDREPRQRPTRLGKEMYGGSSAVMVSCGRDHTLVLTTMGLVWSCGGGLFGQLGHGHNIQSGADARGGQRVQTGLWCLRATGPQRWGRHLDRALGGAAAALVKAGGGHHTVAVTLEGELWVWGCRGHG